MAGAPVLRVRRVGSRYEAAGPSTMEMRHSCNIFARWSWDGATVCAETDCYGVHPLHYSRIPDGILLSPSIQALLESGASRELDYRALSVFLRLGFYPGDDTPFTAIRRLPRGGYLRWRTGELSVQERAPVAQASGLSRHEAIEAYVELFRAAVARRLGDKRTAVMLSGGRDSRHILLEMCRLGRPPDSCFTVDMPSSNDAEVASHLANLLRIRHLVLPASLGARFEAEKNELTNFNSLDHGWILGAIRHIQQHADIVYDGLAGDVLSAGLFLDGQILALFRTRDAKAVARHLLVRNEALVRNLLCPEQYRAVSLETAEARLEKEVRTHLEAPNPVASFYFWNRTRRAVASMSYGMYGQSIQVMTPYLDPELFNLLFSLPPEFMLTHQFHTETIARAHPEYATVDYSVKLPTVFWAGRRVAFDSLCVALRQAAPFRWGWMTPRLLAGILKGGYKTLDAIIPRVVYLAQVQAAGLPEA